MSARFLFVGLLTLLCARAETIPVMWAEFATYGGATGHKDGLSTVAKFNNPSSVARDSGGNLYIADTGNHVIRKIDPTGTVSTLAGTPLQSGNTDGTGANARFNSPSDIEIAPDGTLYVADKGNLLIRTVSPTGGLTTFAGAKSGSNFFISDGVYDKLSVRFQQPTGVALGSDGSGYVADNTAIRVVRPNGTATTFVTSIEQPLDVEIDPTGGLVVSTAGSTGLFRVSDAGIVSPLSANLSSVISGFATIAHAAVADDGVIAAPRQVGDEGAGNLLARGRRLDALRHLRQRPPPSGGVVAADCGAREGDHLPSGG